MKKITSLLVVLMMLVSLLSLTSFAALEGINEDTCTVVNEVVLKGTPVIDGKLDAMYTESLTVKLHGPADAYYIHAGGFCEDTTATGTAYALYDDNYIYAFYQVVDETLIQADPGYVETDAHPAISDAVELRVGDDLEDHFAPYDGSNDAHHLFYADAHGVRFSCYEDSMGDEDIAKMKSATSIADDGKTYYVELAIPVRRPFVEGEIIEFEFQIDDLQDEFGSMCAVGSGVPHKLVSFPIGGESSGAKAPVEEPKVDTPVITPDEPVDTPDEPVDTPDEPVDTPDEPVDTPDEPVDTPDEPVDTPDEPVENPDEPVENPDEPVENPDEPVENPDEPVENPDEPVENPDEPVENPDEPVENPDEPVENPDEPVETPDEPTDTPDEPVEEESNTGLIVGIVIAVVVVIAVVAIIATKKKK